MQRSLLPGLEQTIARIGSLADRPIDSTHELQAFLRQAYHLIHDVNVHDLDIGSLKASAPALLHRLFAARMALRDRIPHWYAQGVLHRPAEAALRDLFRLMRYAGDMLGEIGIANARLGPNEKTRRAFSGRNYNTLVHPSYFNGHDIPFRSGDVLLVRGFAHNSAAIARIGDVDTQFSHVGIVYIDPQGKHWIVEALIEDGAVVNPIEHLLEHIGRAVLYRHKDAKLAARAAELAFRRVEASKGWGRHIPYDFSMRLTGRRKLFCAKLVQQAYLDASNGTLALPTFKTRFDQRNGDFFKLIGVRAKETFAPGDIDIDPNFDLVAEWQDYRVTSALRRQDMVMTKFFEWMETKGDRFKPDLYVRLLTIFGRLSSYLSNGVKDLISSVIPKVPSNMKASTIATIIMLHKSAEEVMPALQELDINHVKMTGRPIHPIEFLDHLERLRLVSGGKIGYLTSKT